MTAYVNDAPPTAIAALTPDKTVPTNGVTITLVDPNGVPVGVLRIDDKPTLDDLITTLQLVATNWVLPPPPPAIDPKI